MSQVREPTTHNWRLSPHRAALHIWFTTFSLSEVLRLTGRSSRCCRQNSRWVAGAAVAREAGARATAAGTHFPRKSRPPRLPPRIIYGLHRLHGTQPNSPQPKIGCTISGRPESANARPAVSQMRLWCKVHACSGGSGACMVVVLGSRALVRRPALGLACFSVWVYWGSCVLRLESCATLTLRSKV